MARIDSTNAVVLALCLLGGCPDGSDFGPLYPLLAIGDPDDPDRSICSLDARDTDCRYDFGEVRVGEGGALTFTLENPSVIDLTVFEVSVQSGSAFRLRKVGRFDGRDFEVDADSQFDSADTNPPGARHHRVRADHPKRARYGPRHRPLRRLQPEPRNVPRR